MTTEEEQQYEIPKKFTPEWPPRPNQKQMSGAFPKCSDKFKKVTWPPKDGEENEDKDNPQATVQLKDEMSLNDEAWKPTGTYKAAPTIYAEQPAQLNEDVWPPPEQIDTSEKVVYDESRRKRVIRDYTVHFSKNKAPEGEKSYKVPPGTLHVISQRGVLSYDTPDIGAAQMAKPE